MTTGNEYWKNEGLIGAVDKGLFDANTILKADVDDTPLALTVNEDRVVGRVSGGVIDDLTIQQVLNMLMAAKGDLIARNATVPDVLSVGANGEFLVPASSDTTGLRWVGMLTYYGQVLTKDGSTLYK